MLKSIVAESYHDSPVKRKTGRSNAPMDSGHLIPVFWELRNSEKTETLALIPNFMVFKVMNRVSSRVTFLLSKPFSLEFFPPNTT